MSAPGWLIALAVVGLLAGACSGGSPFSDEFRPSFVWDCDDGGTFEVQATDDPTVDRWRRDGGEWHNEGEGYSEAFEACLGFAFDAVNAPQINVPEIEWPCDLLIGLSYESGQALADGGCLQGGALTFMGGVVPPGCLAWNDLGWAEPDGVWQAHERADGQKVPPQDVLDAWSAADPELCEAPSGVVEKGRLPDCRVFEFNGEWYAEEMTATGADVFGPGSRQDAVAAAELCEVPS